MTCVLLKIEKTVLVQFVVQVYLSDKCRHEKFSVFMSRKITSEHRDSMVVRLH